MGSSCLLRTLFRLGKMKKLWRRVVGMDTQK